MAVFVFNFVRFFAQFLINLYLSFVVFEHYILWVSLINPLNQIYIYVSV